MTYQLLALAALITELIAVIMLQFRLAPLPFIAAYLAIHGVSCLFASTALYQVLPAKYRHPRNQVVFFFFIFGFFTSVLGIIIIVLACILFLRFRKEHVSFDMNSVTTPPFMIEAPERQSQFGEGGVKARLVNVDVPKEMRVKALMAMEGVSGRISNDLIRIAMQDEDDEVRLLAFGMLDQRENGLNAKISSLLASLETTADAAELAEIHRQTAQLYWELVYQELVRDSLMVYATERALYHAGETVRLKPDDPAVRVLIGRIRMQRKDFAGARQSFTEAHDLGIQESRVVPYLAELAFLDRDFAQVRAFLSNPAFASIPTLSAVVSFWRESQ